LLLGGALLSVWGGFRRRIATAILGLLGIGVSTLFVGLMPATAFWFGVAGLSVVALMIALTNGPVFALLQALVPPEMQARVFTVVQSVSAAMAPLGMAVAGPVADVYGVRVWYIVGGIACALIGAIYRFVPAVTQLEDRYRAPISVE
jgi:DHA3 family macrolide efflux protein-like MFS transporter